MATSVMFTRTRALLILLSFMPALAAQPLYQPLGQAAQALSIAPQSNLSIYPDGRGLPQGSGTAPQGEQLYNQHCLTCHGPGAIGGSAVALVGEIGSLTSEYPEKTVNSYWPYATSLFDYIRRAMPPSAPYSLNSNEIYALCAYILSQDGIIKADVELNAATLPQVTMPNRNGFSAIYPQ